MAIVPVDTAATVSYEQEQNSVTISVTSADGETMYDYVLIFTIERCSINWLNDLRIKGTTVEAFHQDSVVYIVSYPMGTDNQRLESGKFIMP